MSDFTTTPAAPFLLQLVEIGNRALDAAEAAGAAAEKLRARLDEECAPPAELALTPHDQRSLGLCEGRAIERMADASDAAACRRYLEETEGHPSPDILAHRRRAQVIAAAWQSFDGDRRANSEANGLSAAESAFSDALHVAANIARALAPIRAGNMEELTAKARFWIRHFGDLAPEAAVDEGLWAIARDVAKAGALAE